MTVLRRWSYRGRHRANRFSRTVYDLLAAHTWHVSLDRAPAFRSWLSVESVLARGPRAFHRPSFAHERAALDTCFLLSVASLGGAR